MIQISKNYLIFLGIVLLFFSLANTKYSYERGVNRGAQVGVHVALDTVSKLINRKIISDTTVEKLTIANPDTVTYFLSVKSIYRK